MIIMSAPTIPLLQIHTGFRPGDLIFAKVDRSEVIFVPASNDPYRFLIAHDGQLWGIARQLELADAPAPSILLTFETQEQAQQALNEILDALLEPVSSQNHQQEAIKPPIAPIEMAQRTIQPSKRIGKILGVVILFGLLSSGVWWYTHSDDESTPSIKQAPSTTPSPSVSARSLPPVKVAPVPYKAPEQNVVLPGTPGDALMQQMGATPAPVNQAPLIPVTQNIQEQSGKTSAPPTTAGDALLQQMK